MPKRYVISRHQATIDLLRSRLKGELMVSEQLDEALFERFNAGDQVIGNLPLKWVALLTENRIEYWAVDLDYSKQPQLRGRDLSSEELSQVDANLYRYKAISCVGSLE